jgi:hypothetical protein
MSVRFGGRMPLVPIDLPPDYSAFKAEVIADQESDDQGVYEIGWATNGRYADLPESTRLAIAQQVVRELVNEGRVVLVQAQWPRSSRDGEPITDVESTLSATATWAPEDPVVWMTDPPPHA